MECHQPTVSVVYSVGYGEINRAGSDASHEELMPHRLVQGPASKAKLSVVNYHHVAVLAVRTVSYQPYSKQVCGDAVKPGGCSSSQRCIGAMCGRISSWRIAETSSWGGRRSTRPERQRNMYKQFEDDDDDDDDDGGGADLGVMRKLKCWNSSRK
ncbi:hypothetical protein EJ05DRAFT_263803 [Pseudovirgaria hyperparasitica]|uniref:Uncharacterized protein n=1 Tax=Pseudovirgaria hyperparasitica TaxID=470096 RepID=A0A6A6WH48_9PEZI|nr:uncharacterized protein EJ05DRAFT_263803 [Pseudovirgaria hyperparasitica]KAF2761404.1 hypothetical protein EJ05DRAFT_263803 [Pseudovirgaria hyperparasitica]